MSEVWNTLILIQNKLIEKFESTGKEIKEPGMEEFNQPGWINRVWQSDSYRRAHIDVVDAKDTKGLWMMHCCIFPTLTNGGPIFGLDVIAGKNKITGFFHDFSPVSDPEHDIILEFKNLVKDFDWKKERDLPDWALKIFSDHMVAAGNVNNKQELDQIVDLSQKSIELYLSNIEKYNNTAPEDEVKYYHNKYALYQKQNPHTPKTMTSLGLDREQVEKFIHQCLFPKVE